MKNMKYVYRFLLLYFLILLIVIASDYKYDHVNMLNSMASAMGYVLNPVMWLVLCGFNCLYMKTK